MGCYTLEKSLLTGCESVENSQIGFNRQSILYHPGKYEVPFLQGGYESLPDLDRLFPPSPIPPSSTYSLGTDQMMTREKPHRQARSLDRRGGSILATIVGQESEGAIGPRRVVHLAPSGMRHVVLHLPFRSHKGMSAVIDDHTQSDTCYIPIHALSSTMKVTMKQSTSST